MTRMLILGYCFGIRFESRLCQEVHLNLAYRWFCKLDLDDPLPDHSTFSKNRHGRFRDLQTFRLVFKSVLQRCMAEGLVSGEGFTTDARVIKADAQRQRRIAGDGTMDWGDPAFHGLMFSSLVRSAQSVPRMIGMRIGRLCPGAVIDAFRVVFVEIVFIGAVAIVEIGMAR
jgi:Transposase and inactivated derivatives